LVECGECDKKCDGDEARKELLQSATHRSPHIQVVWLKNPAAMILLWDNKTSDLTWVLEIGEQQSVKAIRRFRTVNLKGTELKMAVTLRKNHSG